MADVRCRFGPGIYNNTRRESVVVLGRIPIQLSRMEQMERMERLAVLVPPPGKNQVLYHGVLAPRAAWRQEIVPQPRRKPRSDHAHTRAIIRPERASRSSRWMLWRTLLKRVFEVNGLELRTSGFDSSSHENPIEDDVEYALDGLQTVIEAQFASELESICDIDISDGDFSEG
jgi:hypothetical protein